MENNNKDKPVRVRITAFNSELTWYKQFQEYNVVEYDTYWWQAADKVGGIPSYLIIKTDCEVISPQPEKTASEIYSETYAAKSEVLPELNSGIQ